jgi:hypothetical protein
MSILIALKLSHPEIRRISGVDSTITWMKNPIYLHHLWLWITNDDAVWRASCTDHFVVSALREPSARFFADAVSNTFLSITRRIAAVDCDVGGLLHTHRSASEGWNRKVPIGYIWKEDEKRTNGAKGCAQGRVATVAALWLTSPWGWRGADQERLQGAT